MTRLAALSVILFLTSPALAVSGGSYGNAYVKKIINVYDGDTFRVDISDWPSIVGENISIRVAGLDTPEIRGKCANEKNLALQAKNFVINKLKKARYVELKNIQRGKYFRLVADVYIDNENLTNALLSNGLAYPYDGGKKQTWC